MSLKGPLWASGCPRSQPGYPLITFFLPTPFSATEWELVGATQTQGGRVWSCSHRMLVCILLYSPVDRGTPAEWMRRQTLTF